MLNPRKWLIAASIAAVMPGIAMAGPLDWFRSKKENPAPSASAAPANPSNNQRIAEGVAAALRAARVSGLNINIEVQNGIATVRGQVPDATQQQRAAQVISRVAGVRNVSNQLQVIGRAAFDRGMAQQRQAHEAQQNAQPSRQPTTRPELIARPNQQSQLKPIGSQQEAPTRLLPARPPQPVQQVSRSLPPSPAQNVTARTATQASNTGGPTNQQMANKIAGELSGLQLQGRDIEIRFSNGTATLKGYVADRNQLARAIAAADRVPGVNRVQSELQLMGSPVVQTGGQSAPAQFAAPPVASPMPEMSPQQNQAMAVKIGNALKGSKLTGHDIDVRFRNGTAVLLGKASSSQARSRISQIVAKVPGVRRVQNRLSTPDGVVPPSAVMPASMTRGREPMVPLPIMPVSFQGGPAVSPGAPGLTPPPSYGHPGSGSSSTIYNQPHLPDHAYPSYSSYPNYATVSYPKEYSASAWPYIGPFYPYPQIPLGWRKVQLEWDDGHWALNFNPRTDRWFWFLQPENW